MTYSHVAQIQSKNTFLGGSLTEKTQKRMVVFREMLWLWGGGMKMMKVIFL